MRSALKTVLALVIVSTLSFPAYAETRPCKNRNPLNVKCYDYRDPWVGQIGKDEHGHAIFRHPKYSVRAAGIILKKYHKVHKISTVSEILDRYAKKPSMDYKKFLARKLKVGVNQKFNVCKRLPDIIMYMSQYESGIRLEKEIVLQGLCLCPRES